MYLESTTEHLPDLLHQVITAATGCVEAASDVELTAILSMCSKLLSRVQPSMATPGGDDPFDNDSLYRVPDTTSLPEQEGAGCSVEGDGGVGVGATKDGSKVAKDMGGQSVASPSEVVSSKGLLEDESKSVGENLVDSDVASRTLEPRVQREVQKDLSNDNPNPSSSGDTSTARSSTKEVPEQSRLKPSAEKPPKPPSEPKKEGASESKALQERQLKELPLKSTTRDRDSVRSAARQKSREDRPREHLGLMQQCLGSFQEFFHCIVTHRFLESEVVCEKCMELLSLGPSEGCRTSDQDSLFDESSTCSADSDAIRTKLLESGSHPKVKPRMCTDEGQVAFSRACRLLVDFASFPLYCADYQTVIDQMYNTGKWLLTTGW